MNSRLQIAAVLLFALAGPILAAPASRPGQPHALPAEPNKTFVHQPTGFEFPFNVNAFRRASVVAFDDANRNVAVGYADPALKIIITVYVYPNHGLAEATHFKQVKQDVQRVNPTAKLLDERQISLDPPPDAKQSAKRTGSFARFTMHGQLSGAEQELMSEAYLFTHGENFVKFRLTYPAADAKAAQPRVENFLKALTFPELKEEKPKS